MLYHKSNPNSNPSPLLNPKTHTNSKLTPKTHINEKNLKFGENIPFGKIESEWEWEGEVSVRELEKIVIERWESEWERVRDSEERDERLSERSEWEKWWDLGRGKEKRKALRKWWSYFGFKNRITLRDEKYCWSRRDFRDEKYWNINRATFCATKHIGRAKSKKII